MLSIINSVSVDFDASLFFFRVVKSVSVCNVAAKKRTKGMQISIKDIQKRHFIMNAISWKQFFDLHLKNTNSASMRKLSSRMELASNYLRAAFYWARYWVLSRIRLSFTISYGSIFACVVLTWTRKTNPKHSMD